jgi:GTPase Era involved in 16S rRNA processing
MEFKTEEVKRLYQEKMEEIKRIVDTPIDDTKYLWDETTKRYALKIENVKKILEINEIRGNVREELFNQMNVFLQRCSSPEFHIALVGAVKAGKSTLINAFLGENLASTEVTPETAVLTKFKKSETDYVKVEFYSDVEWKNIWEGAKKERAEIFLEEYQKLDGDNEKDNWLNRSPQRFDCGNLSELREVINKWTSSKSPTHYFVKNVTVGLKNFELPEGVVMVDTPGLDDVVPYRSEITKKYIDRANAVLVCIRSDALTGAEYTTLLRVFKNTHGHVEKVYVLATQIDTLNQPKTDWGKQREEWLKSLKRSDCFGTEQIASERLIPVSAYLYTLLRGYNDGVINQDSDEYFDLISVLMKMRIRETDLNKRYRELMEFTDIDYMRNIIKTDIVSGAQKGIVDDIVDSFKCCQGEISKCVSEIKADQNEIIEASNGSLDDIKKRKEDYEKQLQEAAKEKTEIEHLVEVIRHTTNQRVEELISELKEVQQGR